MLGTMLINILGCGSGLSLGAATILVRDVYGNFKRRMGMTASPLSSLAQTRLSIVGILVAAVIATLVFHSSFINDLGFLSLGLRAVAIVRIDKAPLFSCQLVFRHRSHLASREYKRRATQRPYA